MIAGSHCFANAILKSNCPVPWFIRTSAQVMNNISARHDEYAFIAKRRETFSKLVVKPRRLPFVHAELNDWNAGFREDVT